MQIVTKLKVKLLRVTMPPHLVIAAGMQENLRWDYKHKGKKHTLFDVSDQEPIECKKKNGTHVCIPCMCVCTCMYACRERI
jgi:hypothetical protein